ncbi:MAG TPA: hypothetical protein VE914_18640 [Candidatus Angelobacter sp.]|nr:hypothetical protein [Candidatus Angelobacter sp.]
MMQGMMDCGGWLMMGMGILLTIVLGLGAAALVKYLFFSRRGGSKNERTNADTDSGVSSWSSEQPALA